MTLHHFVGSGFPRTSCAVCGGPVNDARHLSNVIVGEELEIERERSAARRREALDRFKRTVTPEERSLDWKTKGGFRRKNRKQRGER